MKEYQSTKLRMSAMRVLWRISGEFQAKMEKPISLSDTIEILGLLYNNHREEALKILEKRKGGEKGWVKRKRKSC